MNTNIAPLFSEFAEVHVAGEHGIVPRPGLASERSLDSLSDDDVLANTRRLVGRSNQIFAALLMHLAEVEARGLYRLRACSSLYTYCIYELRFSEDAAFRRVCAARLVKRLPALLPAIERGELHLTGLLLLGPHLTPENHIEVLLHAKHRTKKEIAKLVRVLDPLPEVPARIAPLGPAPARVAPAQPSWERLAHSLNPVRELTPGDRPSDWIATAADDATARDDSDDATARDDSDESDGAANDTQQPAPARVFPAHADEDAEEAPPAPAPIPTPLSRPQRYQVQFTVNDAYVELVERAKALLSHAAPNAGLADLHLRALRALVAELEKRRYAVNTASAESAHGAPQKRTPPARPETPPARPETPPARPETTPARPETTPARHPRQRGRAVPAAVRREVWTRDGARCSYVDSTSGQRCRETAYLELHHEVAHARGGPHSTSNLTLRCSAHNALAAEADFGRELCTQQRDAARHESYVQQQRCGSA